MTNTRTAGSLSAPFGAPLSQRSNQRSCRSSARLSASGPKSHPPPVFLTHGMWMYGPITSRWPARAAGEPPSLRPLRDEFSTLPVQEHVVPAGPSFSAGTWTSP